MISHLTCGWSGELLDAGCCPQCGEPYPIDYDYFITAPVTEVEEFDRHPKSKKYKKKKLNVTRQANPVEAAGPVAGETETTSETTISVEG